MKLPKVTELLDIKGKEESLEPAKVPDFDYQKIPKEVYLSWEVIATHEVKGLSKRFIRAFTIIGIFIGLLLLIMQEFFVILIVGSLIFVTQAMMKLTPEATKYELSSHGLKIGDNLYYWDHLRRFFFILREGTEVIAVDTTLGFPGRLFISFNKENKEQIKGILIKYLHFLEEEPRTFFDNAYDRVIKKFSIEDKE
ncbi:MAG: hypothetical protein WAX66_02365 [Patescibacteria group bacterium]